MEVAPVLKGIWIRKGKEAAIESIDAVLVQALTEAAAKTEGKVDDTLVALLAEPLKQALKDLLAKA